MHRLTRGLEKRLEALERVFERVPEPETPQETSRRLALCRSALYGEDLLDDLTEEERETFEKAVRYKPLFLELLEEGIITPSGEPGGDDQIERSSRTHD